MKEFSRNFEIMAEDRKIGGSCFCATCHMTFFRKWDYANHISVMNHDSKMNQNADAEDNDDDDQAVLDENENEIDFPFCEYCYETFPTEKGLESHMRKYHEPKLECNHCQKPFKSLLGLQGHVRRFHVQETKESIKKYKCNKCDNRFDKKGQLLEHVRYVHFEYDHKHEGYKGNDSFKESIKKYKCSKCDNSFKRKDQLLDHVRYVHFEYTHRHNEDESTECEKCDKTFANVSNLERHIKTVHQKSTYLFYCEKCDKNFCSKKNMQDHNARVHKAESEYFVCKVSKCMARCKDEEGLKLHMKNYHERNRSTTCDQCGKEFENVHLLGNHVKNVHFSENGGKYLMCKVSRCIAKFENEVSLKLHMKNYHERNRSTICDQCGKSYVNTSALCQHEKLVHLKLKEEAECDICGKILANKDGLKGHKLAIHKRQLGNHEKNVHFSENGEKYLMCKVSRCSGKFENEVTRKLHMKNFHERNRSTICDQCGKSYVNTSALCQHEKLVHLKLNEEAECDICGKILAHKESLKRHKLAVHNENGSISRKMSDHRKFKLIPTKEAECDICGNILASKGNLKRHKLKIHTIQLDKENSNVNFADRNSLKN